MAYADAQLAGFLRKCRAANREKETGILYGNPDRLVSGSDAMNALCLVADKSGIAIAQNETIPTLRAGQLRQLLRNKFGQAEAEQTMAAL
jgi:hypothetical protein